ncbi:PGAM-domain-containing protein, partial [Rhizodiscina lignyota]
QMIILIRHAQSEGNKNRDIHQFVPDHRVKLTPDGWQQAEEAGRRLRSVLKPDDTIQFYTSPYRRTRETTEAILKTLTQDDPHPSPFPRHHITVYEEPRLREQDFGNFQPCSAEMERMWQERADYGHFFYRIPNGESAADAYDRISGFNESLWRQFGEKDFPSVCVLYFEDLRNINHCEFITMKQNMDNGKYVLENQLRTWSELKKRAAAVAGNEQNGRKQSISKGLSNPRESSPGIPIRRWGGCVNGCNHAHMDFPRRARRQNTQDFMQAAAQSVKKSEIGDSPAAPKDPEQAAQLAVNGKAKQNDDTPVDPANCLSPGLASASSEGDDVFSSDGDTRPNFLNV